MSTEKKKTLGLGIGTWVAIMGLVLATVTGAGVLLTRLYATTSSFDAYKLSNTQSTQVWRDKQTQVQNVIKIEQTKIRGDAARMDWQLQRVQVQVENLEKRGARTEENMIRLMARFRVEPVAAPTYKSLPKPPPKVPPTAGTSGSP